MVGNKSVKLRLTHQCFGMLRTILREDIIFCTVRAYLIFDKSLWGIAEWKQGTHFSISKFLANDLKLLVCLRKYRNLYCDDCCSKSEKRKRDFVVFYFVVTFLCYFKRRQKRGKSKQSQKTSRQKGNAIKLENVQTKRQH